ncbi:MAG: hypothetical protein IJQ34_00770 [Kiritimatiellae bacterium]|nr:hypothetical protein [Kiritimatiellia bacterium]
MKKFLILSLLLASVVSLADDENSPIIAETLSLNGTTNTWTQADLIAALQLMNRKYHRDVDNSLAGRQAWHGKLISQEIDEENEIKISTYEDGTQFIDKFTAQSPAREVEKSNSQLPRTLNTKGIPPALQEARVRREAEKVATNVVNNVIIINPANSEEK